MKRRIVIELTCLLLLLAALAFSSTQTINTLPSASSTFITDNQAFLRNELANYNEARFVGYMTIPVTSGGTAAASADLTHTISSVTGFPRNYYASQAATAHTYTANTRTFVYLRDDTDRTVTIAGAAITYSTRLVFAEMAAGSARPDDPTGCLPLMYADTDAVSITGVVDLRPKKTYFIQSSSAGVVTSGITTLVIGGVTVIEPDGAGGVSIYANTINNSGVTNTTISGVTGEIATIGSAANTVSGIPKISGTSITGTVPMANLYQPYESGLSTTSRSVLAQAAYANVTSGNSTIYITLHYGGRLGNSGAVGTLASRAGVTMTLEAAKQGMEMLFFLNWGQLHAHEIWIIPNAADSIVGATSFFVAGASAFYLSGVSSSSWLALSCWQDGVWVVTGASASVRNVSAAGFGSGTMPW